MSSISRALASPLPLEHQGITYWMRPATWAMLGCLEQLFAADALARVEHTRDYTDPDRYAERLEAAARLVERNHWRYDGRIFQEQLATRRGLTLLAWLMLRDQPPHPDLVQVEQLLRERPEDVEVRVRLLNRPAPERPRREGAEHDPQREREPVPFETQVAILKAEPLLMTLEEVGNLTPYQTSEIVFHRRDKQGNIRLPGSTDGEINDGAGKDLLDVFACGWRLEGLSEEEIGRRWEALVDRMAGVAPVAP